MDKLKGKICEEFYGNWSSNERTKKVAIIGKTSHFYMM